MVLHSMIKATCCCLSSIEFDTGYRDDDILQIRGWLDRHSKCVDVSCQRGMNSMEKEENYGPDKWKEGAIYNR